MSASSSITIFDTAIFVIIVSRGAVRSAVAPIYAAMPKVAGSSPVLQHILSPLHNLSSTTKRAALTAHFVASCINCRPKATKCAAVHGTFCRPRERKRERGGIHHVIKSDFIIPSKKAWNSNSKICNKWAYNSAASTYCAHIATMLPLGVST